ncbi:alpha/beta hydrolase [Pseudonocardia sp.]|uniref:alpha/beta fold hydrolase n=1 Tax=Pseudonocardia sp. TaxID=60912 RepID=UPI0026358D60|nr:alpha/beta hydrolase [Pseudonocardia sp.]
MTTYVLVHGGFTDSWYWGETAALLERDGHRVLLVELPSTGTDPATLGGLVEDAAETRRVIDSAGEPVVLVGHSSGGMVITEVADHPGIAHTVYVSAMWPQRGAAVGDVLAQMPPMEWTVPNSDGTAVAVTSDVEVAHRYLCADLDPARVPEWHAGLMFSGTRGMATPSSAPDRAHPTTYVVLEQDRAIPVQAQEAMATGADRIERLGTGHVPQLTDPDGLAAVLARVPVPARPSIPVNAAAGNAGG